jgi:hypothetical protein
MWPFKKKEKQRKPKTDLDYFFCGIQTMRGIKKKYPNPIEPTYTPSKIIQSKQLT